MKQLLFSLLLIIFCATAYTQNGYSDCDYHLEQISEGEYRTTIIGYDSISKMESCFTPWLIKTAPNLTGTLWVYDENDIKRRMLIYQDGIRIGKHLEWYATGELESETVWDAETNIYFEEKSYYKSGKIAHTSVNGNRDDAIYTAYFENGKIASIDNSAAQYERKFYENGNKESERFQLKKTFQEWYPNGKLKISGSLDHSGYSRIGKWLFYDKKGKLIKELIYDDNNYEGSYDSDEGYIKEIKH